MGIHRALLVCLPIQILLTFLEFWLTIDLRFTDLFDSVGIAKTSGVVAALIMGASFIPTALLHWKGEKWYSRD